MLLIWGMVNGQGKYYLVPDTIYSGLKYNLFWASHLISSNQKIVFNGLVFSNAPSGNNNYHYLSSVDEQLQPIITPIIYEDTFRYVSPQWINSLTKDSSTGNLYELGGIQWQFTGMSEKKIGYITKYDSSLNILSSVNFGDSSKFYLPMNIEFYDNSIYISASRRLWDTVTGPTKFYLLKFDKDLNLIWEKEYAGLDREYCYGSCIKDDRIYLTGLNLLIPYYDEKVHHLIKITDTSGNLIQSKYLPYKLNNSLALSCVFDDSNFGVKLISISTQNIENVNLVGNLSYDQIRFNVLDSQLNLISMKIIQRDLPMVYRNLKKISESKMLIMGAKYIDTNLHNLGAWACLIDTSGTIVWDRTFNIRNNADHYLTDGIMLSDGSFAFSGTVFGTSSTITQDALLIKVDSNGCIDSTNCFPLNVSEINEINPRIKLYPNPTNGILNVDIEGQIKKEDKLFITDIAGNPIYTSKKVTAKNSIDAVNWANGIYLMKYISENKIYNYKILKQ